MIPSTVLVLVSLQFCVWDGEVDWGGSASWDEGSTVCGNRWVLVDERVDWFDCRDSEWIGQGWSSGHGDI